MELPQELVLLQVKSAVVFSLKLFSCTLHYMYDLILGRSNAAEAYLTIYDCFFAANSLNYAILVTNSDFTLKLDVSIRNCTFSSNNGAVLFDSKFPYSESIILNITDSTFLNNWNLQSGGGAICASYANIGVYHSQFIENIVEGSGGAIDLYSSSMMIFNCTFKSNSAQADGGAISSFDTQSLVLHYCFFQGNVANLPFHQNLWKFLTAVLK